MKGDEGSLTGTFRCFHEDAVTSRRRVALADDGVARESSLNLTEKPNTLTRDGESNGSDGVYFLLVVPDVGAEDAELTRLSLVGAGQPTDRIFHLFATENETTVRVVVSVSAAVAHEPSFAGFEQWEIVWNVVVVVSVVVSIDGVIASGICAR